MKRAPPEKPLPPSRGASLSPGSAPPATLISGAGVLAIAALAALGAGLVTSAEISAGHDTALHLLAIAALGTLALASILQFARFRRAAPTGLDNAALIAHLLREKDAAETANAAKTRYLANVSHEIRSPLNAIYGYAQLVEHQDGANAAEAARVIRRSAEHLTSLVEGLLDISQLENGVLRVKRDVIRLAPFLDQIAGMMRPAAIGKGLAFHFELPQRLPEFVRVDQGRLRQVLINLLSNAIKFTASGSVTFRFTWSGEIAVFEISDTGPGIPAEDQERIFDPYDRGQGACQHAQPGVGLGLPIAKAIVEILGGKLELDSTPGQGATFRVTMLLGHVAGIVPSEAPARRICGYEGPSRSILLVDDDPRQLSFMRALLERLGFVVWAMADGEAADAIAQERGFDLAILDISLPGISGWEVALRLRRRHGAGLPIIMLSANAPEFHRPDFPEPVHDMFLVKPVEFGALADGIGGLLELAWKWETVSPDDADAAPPPPPPPAGPDLGPAAREEINQLLAALRIGHVRGIEAGIGRLAAAAPDAQGLVAELYDYLDRFDLSAMSRKLETI